MAIDKGSLIIVEDDQLLDANTVASLAILLSSAGVTKMPKILGPEVRVMVTKVVAIRAMVIFMVVVVGRLMVKPMPWNPMISRGIRLVIPFEGD